MVRHEIINLEIMGSNPFGVSQNKHSTLYYVRLFQHKKRRCCDLIRNKLWIVILAILLLCCVDVYAAIEQPISFMQNDVRWGSEPYTITNSRSQTIATSGCGPTSMAMVLNYYIDDTITPLHTAKYALENHYRTYNNGTSWAYFSDVADKYDLDFLQTSSSTKALEWMNTKENPLIICSMSRGLWTRYGHFILLWDVNDGVAYINDPASTEHARIENSYTYMASQCKQYFCFNQPLQNDSTYSIVKLHDDPILISFILQGREETISPLNKLENVGVSPTPTQLNKYLMANSQHSISLGNLNIQRSYS